MPTIPDWADDDPNSVITPLLDLGARMTSGLRTPEHNRKVGGVPSSKHLSGRAADLVPGPNMTMAQLEAEARKKLPGAKVLNERNHVHVQWDDRPTNSSIPDWADKPKAAVPDWADTSDDAEWDAAIAKSKVKPKEKWSNFLPGVTGSFKQAVTNNLLVHPVRWAMEAADFGGYKQKLRDRFPGKPDKWYDEQMDKVYDQAIVQARKDATKQVTDNPYPGHIVPNTVAAVLGSASPIDLIAPGVKYAGKVAPYLAKQAGIGAATNAAEDVVNQGIDVAEGITEDFDVKRLATNTALGAGFGAGVGGIHLGVKSQAFQDAVTNSPAPEFVKNLFRERGKDTTPEAEPFKSEVGAESKVNTDELRQRQKDVFQHGTSEDINAFYDEVGGPRPSQETVDNWLQTREQLGAAAAPKPEVLDGQIHRDNLRAHIDNETKTWKNKPDVNIVDTLDDFEPEVRATAERDGITPENTVGFLGSDGKVHIFANQIKTPEAASAVLFHEALGHYGLAQRFGSKLDSTLQTLVTRNVGQFGKKVDQWMEQNPGAYGGNKLRAAEEVLAEMSQNGPLPKSISDAVVASLRQFARRMGVELKYSDIEVNHILSMAHDAVINGKGRDVIGNRFGGLNYQATDFGAEPESRQMYAGIRADIIPQTGSDKWFAGPDGNYRFEINDNQARWDDNHSLSKPEGAHLDEVLIHPELFKAYPELRNVRVVRDVSALGASPTLQGFLDPNTGKIHLSPRALDPRSTILHEVQHWIQYKEGFAFGGSSETIRLDDKEALGNLANFYQRELDNVEAGRLPRSSALIGIHQISLRRVLNDRLKRVKELIESSDGLKQTYKVMDDALDKGVKLEAKIKELRKQLNKRLDIKGMDPRRDVEFNQIKAEYNKTVEARKKLLDRYTNVTELFTGIKGKYSDLSYDMYNLLTGEVEARDVQARRNLTPEEREMSTPYSAEGIQPNEMINYYPSTNYKDIPAELTPSGQLKESDVDPSLLDNIDRLKQDPRFWSSPEFRANVIELARTRGPVEVGPQESSIPAPSGFKSEAEAREAANRRMTPEQLRQHVEDGSLDIEQLEQRYDRVYSEYEPTYRSDAEVRRAAIDAGIQPHKVKRSKDMDDLSARIYRAQEAAKTLDERLAKLAAKEGTPEWSARDADNARKAIADHYYILNRLYDDKSELGRALRIAKMGYTHAEMRAYKELLAEDGGTLSPLADDETLSRFLRSYKTLAAGGANPNGVNALVMGLKKPNWEEYLLSARVNMMLSGMSTHVTAITDMIDGIGLDLMDSTAGLIPSLGREGLRALGLPVKPGIHPAEVGARYWGVLRSAMEAGTYVNALKTLQHGSNRHTTGGRTYARVPILSKVGDLIAAEDQFFRAFATNMHLYGLGVRKAVSEARAAGKKFTMDDLISQGASYARTPDSEMLRAAQRAAEENLLLAPNRFVTGLEAMRQRLNTDTQGAKSGGDAAQRALSFLVNFQLPFVRTAANSLYQRVWRRTPLTFFDPHTLGDLKQGGARADVAMGRIMLGTASVMLAWTAAEQGITSGDGPDNPYKKALKMAGGWRPKSVKVEGKGDEPDRYNINQNLGNRLNPFDMNSQTATLVASMHDAYKKGANEGQVATGIKMAVYNSIKNLADNSWLGDIAKDIETFSKPGATDRRDQFIADQLASFTPNLLAQIARTQDQGQPMTTVPGDLGETIVNTFKSKIPGQRETLPDRMTPFGEPVQSGATLAGQTSILPQGNRVTGGAYIEATDDPVEQEILRLDDLFEESLVTAARRTVKIDGEKVKLTNEQYSEYQELAGKETVESVRDMMSTEDWAQMDDEAKASWIKKEQTAAKKRVREYLGYD